MSQPPTAEAIAQAVAHGELLAELQDEPGGAASAEVVRFLLTLVADYVPVEDRERAVCELADADTLNRRAWNHDCTATRCAFCEGLVSDERGKRAEARRLLKLPALDTAS